jgi:hypothetical protein
MSVPNGSFLIKHQKGNLVITLYAHVVPLSIGQVVIRKANNDIVRQIIIWANQKDKFDAILKGSFYLNKKYEIIF